MPPSAHGRLNGRGGWCLPNRRHRLVKRQAAGVIPCDDAVAGNTSDRRGHNACHCAHVAVGFIEGVAHLVDAPSRVHYGTFKPLLIRARERHDHVLLSHSASLPNERRTRTGQNQGVRTAGKKKPRPAPWEAPKSGAERAGSAEPTPRRAARQSACRGYTAPRRGPPPSRRSQRLQPPGGRLSGYRSCAR